MATVSLADAGTRVRRDTTVGRGGAESRREHAERMVGLCGRAAGVDDLGPPLAQARRTQVAKAHPLQVRHDPTIEDPAALKPCALRPAERVTAPPALEPVAQPLARRLRLRVRAELHSAAHLALECIGVAPQVEGA